MGVSLPDTPHTRHLERRCLDMAGSVSGPRGCPLPLPLGLTCSLCARENAGRTGWADPWAACQLR